MVTLEHRKVFFVRALKKALVFTLDLVRSTNFKFSTFQYSRLIHFEELDPNTLSPTFQRTLKKLFEGDEELIDIKYSKPVKISAVPVIITTNYDPDILLRKLCNGDEASYKAFINRIHVYKLVIYISFSLSLSLFTLVSIVPQVRNNFCEPQLPSNPS